MSRRTRVFVLLASAVVLVGLASAGVASYMGLEAQGGSLNNALDYVPADAEVVAFADVRRLMDSEIGRKLQPNLTSPRDPAMNIFAQAGVDIRTDVDSIVMVALPGEASPAGPPALVFARGNFDSSRIEALVIEHGGTATDYKGARLAEAQQPALAVAFLGSGLVAIGRPAAVRSALDTKSAGTSGVKSNAAFMRLIDKVDEQATWAVAKFDAIQRRGPLPPALVEHLPAITWFAAGGQADSGISGTLYAEAKDEQSAKDLREVIQGVVALVRLQAGQHPEYQELVNSIELTGDGTSISVGFSISAETFERLGALAAPRVRGIAPGAVVGPRRFAPSRLTGQADSSI